MHTAVTCFSLLITFLRCPSLRSARLLPLLLSCHGSLPFQVKKEGCQQFEDTWKNRESNLKDTPGFVRFALLKGDEEGRQTVVLHSYGLQRFILFTSLVLLTMGYCLWLALWSVSGEYISQSTWASREDFKNWTQSQNVSPAVM